MQPENRKRGRPKKRRVVRRRIPKPVPLEDQKEIAADMGMTLWEYTNYLASEARRKSGQGKLRGTYKNLNTNTEDIDLDLRKILKIQPKKGPIK